MPKPQIAARIDERLDRKVDEVIEEEDMSSRSEATRFLVERGIYSWEGRDRDNYWSIVPKLAMVIIALLALFGGFFFGVVLCAGGAF